MGMRMGRKILCNRQLRTWDGKEAWSDDGKMLLLSVVLYYRIRLNVKSQHLHYNRL